MLGQMLVGRFTGSAPSPSFLEEIRLGRIGGVILYAENLSRGSSVARNVVARLQTAANEGGLPPLLIMTDQEGGEVRRLTWAPPRLAPSQMASTQVAAAEGADTGRALRSVGINMDLAPVADVIGVSGSFLRTRSFGSAAALVGQRACAFAEGLASAGVAFTLKHFPGLGRASTSTDTQPTTVAAPAGVLREDYRAYSECGAQTAAVVMISSGGYPNLTGTSQPAVLSPEIYQRELPLATNGEEPITISDDLESPAIAPESTPGERAINAGLDLLLYASTEKGAQRAYNGLIEDVRARRISTAALRRASLAVLTLKEIVAAPLP
jgi:beta-N-acetylhexosaminidase